MMASAQSQAPRIPLREKTLSALRWVTSAIRTHPVTSGVMGITLLSSILVLLLPVPQATIDSLLITSPDTLTQTGNWWSPLTSLFYVSSPATLLLVLLIQAVAVGTAEQASGGRRALLAYIVTGLVGVLITTGLQAIGLRFGDAWSANVRHLFATHAFAAAFGALAWASPRLPTPARRRARAVPLIVGIVAVAYSGNVTDISLLAGVVTGLVFGALDRHRVAAPTWSRSTHHEVRNLLGSASLVMSIGPVLTLFSQRRLGALTPLALLLTDELPDGDTTNACLVGNVSENCVQQLILTRLSSPGSVLLTLIPLATLVAASIGLFRGRRFAAQLVIWLNVGTAVLAAYYFGFLPLSGRPYVVPLHSGRHWEVALSLIASAALPLIMAIVVALNLRHFSLRSDPRKLRRLLVAAPATLLLCSAAFLGVGVLRPSSFTPEVSFADLLADLPEHFIPIGFLRLEQTEFLPNDWLGQVVYDWIGPVFWVVVFAGVVATLADFQPTLRSDEEQRVRSLLLRGGGPLSHMAGWPGNRHYFTDDRQAGIAFRLEHGVALTVAEPFGDSRSRERCAFEFATYCDDHGWTPVFYSVDPTLATSFRSRGWSTLSVGEQTLVDPRGWAPTGKRAQNVRTALHRADREGVTARWATYRDLSIATRSQIAQFDDEWTEEKALPEMGFTLGGLDELDDPRVGLLLAEGADGTVHAVTSWLPFYQDGTRIGWTLDYMRHRSDAMKGVMEFLVASMIQRQRDDPEIVSVSLSVAPLAHSDDDAPSPSTLERFLDTVADRLEPAYGFASLHAFKMRFRPTVEPAYLVYPDPTALPAIGLAVVSAYLPGLTVRDVASAIRSLGSSH